MTSSELAYRLTNFKKEYQSKMILDIPQLEIKEGEFFAIVGPSGSGKSTLLRLMDLLEYPTSGKMTLLGEKIKYSKSLSVRPETGMLFQRSELINGSVRDNIEFPLKLRKLKSNTDIERVINMLSLKSLEHADAKNLSGGEIQRVALARVLVTNPQVLLLDEPTANLDPYHVEIIENTVKGLKDDGVTVILVTHNVFQARRLADRIGLLLKGKFIEVAERNIFFDNPQDKRAKDFVEGKMLY